MEGGAVRTKVIGVLALLLGVFCFAFAGSWAVDAMSASSVDSTTLVPGAGGQAGTAGADGADGRDGVDGTDGIDGTDGSHGRDGVDGARGATGMVGARGPEGPQGAAGSKGDTGADGPKGDMGSPGPAGADGADGADAQLDVRTYTAEDLTVTRTSGLTVVVEPDLAPGTWLLGATVRNMTGNAFYEADACRFDGTGPSGRAHVPYGDTVTFTTVWVVADASPLTFGCSVGAGAVFDSHVSHLTVWAIKLSD